MVSWLKYWMLLIGTLSSRYLVETGGGVAELGKILTFLPVFFVFLDESVSKLGFQSGLPSKSTSDPVFDARIPTEVTFSVGCFLKFSSLI